MKRIALSVFALAITAQSASADTTGQRALALAALVAKHSPSLSGQDKHAMERLFDGHLGFPFPANRKITVQADAVLCRASNVDITSRSCTLTFGTHTPMLKARKAHELFATIAEAGVPEDGAGRQHLRRAVASQLHDRSGGDQAEGRRWRGLQVRSRRLALMGHRGSRWTF